MFYSNFVRLCKKNGKTPSAVAEELGFSRAASSGWADGSKPRKSTLIIIADYFGITVEELMSGVEDAKKETPDPTIEGKRSTVSSFIRESTDASVLLDIMNEVAQKLKELEKKNGK